VVFMGFLVLLQDLTAGRRIVGPDFPHLLLLFGKHLIKVAGTVVWVLDKGNSCRSALLSISHIVE